MSLKPEKRRGGIAALVAVCLFCLLGVVAVALDAGLLVDNRHRVQAAADAAAIAAAADLYTNWYSYQGVDTPGTARSSALSVALVNGYNNDGTTSTVTVNIPPKSGNSIGKAGYAEVIIRYNQKRGLSNIFGAGDLPVDGRAVARGMRKGSGVGILLLNPSTQGAFTLTGTAGMTVAGKVIVNSSSSKAAVSSGSAGLTSSTMDITGSYYSSSSTSYFLREPPHHGRATDRGFSSRPPGSRSGAHRRLWQPWRHDRPQRRELPAGQRRGAPTRRVCRRHHHQQPIQHHVRAGNLLP